MNAIRSLLAGLLLLFVLPLAGCSPLGSEPVPDISNSDLGLNHLRTLASSLPEDRPSSLDQRRALRDL